MDGMGSLSRLVLDGPSGAADSDFGALSNLRKMRVSVACRAAMVCLGGRMGVGVQGPAWMSQEGSIWLVNGYSL